MRLRRGSVTQLSDIAGVDRLLEESAPLMDRSAYLQCDSRMDHHDGIPNYFALYERRKLISIITLFTPREKEAELSALTHPDYRKRGYFNRLYGETLKVLGSYGFERVLFVSCSGVPADFSLPDHLGLSWEFSEYQLLYEPEKRLESSIIDSLSVRKAVMEDRTDLIRMNSTIFPEDAAVSDTVITSTLKDPSRTMYLLEIADTVIGGCAAAFTPDTIFLYSIGILPDHQNRGYGKMFLQMVLDIIVRSGKKICLEVDSTNDRAKHLYEKAGFVTKTENRYFLKRLDVG